MQEFSCAFLGSKFPCSCAKCGTSTTRDWEQAKMIVAKNSDGKWKTFCAKCAGWTTKNKIGSGIVGTGPKTFSIDLED